MNSFTSNAPETKQELKVTDSLLRHSGRDPHDGHSGPEPSGGAAEILGVGSELTSEERSGRVRRPERVRVGLFEHRTSLEGDEGLKASSFGLWTELLSKTTDGVETIL